MLISPVIYACQAEMMRVYLGAYTIKNKLKCQDRGVRYIMHVVGLNMWVLTILM